MNNSTMKPGASPGGTGVRRLNRVPILILIGIIGLVLAGLGWALYQRGQMVQGGEGAAGDQPIEARDTGMLADLLAGYQQGHVVEGTRPAEDKPEMPEIPEALVYIEPDQRRPIPQPVRTVPAPVSPPLPQPVQPAPDPEPTPAEIAAGQRRLQADEMLYQSLLQALSAPTAVQGGAQGGGSQGGSRASALPPARTAGAAGAITPGAGESRTGLQQQALARQAQQQARQDELAERGLTALDALAAGLQQGAVSRTGSPDSSSGTGSGSGAGTKGTGGTGRLAGTGGFSG
nr:hypothetical protein [Thiolinea sp.]